MNPILHRQMNILEELQTYMGQTNIDDAKRCCQRLYTALPDKDVLSKNGIFVAFGGGKDSSYMVTFVRFLQLLILQEYGDTFRLRVATNRHAGMPYAVMENIDRVYRALDFYEDPLVETLLIDGNMVQQFERDLPLTLEIQERNRTDILMTGHRCNGDPRPTFCNACNLSMVNSFGVALAYGREIDLVITGDSLEEQRAYSAWVKQLLQKFGLKKPISREFSSFLAAVNEISQYYFEYIHGGENHDELESHKVTHEGISKPPLFFSIYKDTPYRAGDHWELLTDYLGFKFDDLAFSFTETDCANPALMAHLRGLKVELLYGRSYEEGISEYVSFAIGLMSKKEFPENLIRIAKERYSTPNGIENMRQKVVQYAMEAYNITEEQFICMIFSPFAGRGGGLEKYLSSRAAHLLPYLSSIQKLLSDPNCSIPNEDYIKMWLTSLSGLNLSQLHVLYESSAANSLNLMNAKSPISVVLDGDPHKAVILTKKSPDGPIVEELISGR